MSDTKVSVDAEALITLRDRAAEIGTLEAWSRMACDWARAAQQALTEARPLELGGGGPPARVQDQLDAARWRAVKEMCGHLGDGSDQVVTLFHDDATRTAHVKVGDRRIDDGATRDLETIIDRWIARNGRDG